MGDQLVHFGNWCVLRSCIITSGKASWLCQISILVSSMDKRPKHILINNIYAWVNLNRVFRLELDEYIFYDWIFQFTSHDHVSTRYHNLKVHFSNRVRLFCGNMVFPCVHVLLLRPKQLCRVIIRVVRSRWEIQAQKDTKLKETQRNSRNKCRQTEAQIP